MRPTTVVEPLPTRDHTERLLRMCDIDVDSDGTKVTVHPGEVQPFGFRVPGDISSAAFFLALAAARPGWRVRCPGVTTNPGQDRNPLGARDDGRATSSSMTWNPAGGVEPVGDVEVAGAPLARRRDRRLADGAVHRRVAGDRSARDPGRRRHRDPRRR